MKLTKKQEEILEFIKGFIAAKGLPPTIREIGRQFRIGYRAAYDHLKALERKEYLKRRSPKSRDLELREFITSAKNLSTQKLPILGKVAAGVPLLAVENLEGTLNLPFEWMRGREGFLLRVKGDSMREAHILPGDLVMVKKQPTAEEGEIVVALVRKEEATVKRFFRRRGYILLQPENPSLKPIELPPEEVEILGVVKGVIRLFK